MHRGARARLLVAAAVMVCWAPLLQQVAGQGLSISPEQLGAGEAAVVGQFERFEEILDLYSQSTGGRGRGGRGGTTSTTGGIGFRSVKSLQQLQLATYHLAGSPAAYNSWNTSQNKGGISLLPGVRDQRDCDSCVAQAIAAAIQASAGAKWRQNADQARFNVSAASLYYCSEGGKTCKTGWDLQEALAMLMDKSQFLIRPTACARKTTSGMLHNPTGEPQVFDWKPACQEAQRACSSVSSRALPWLSCSYKSLSSFVDVQRHIRQHGGVVTRITIYDDFWKHFNITTDNGEPRATVNGATHKAYNRTADSSSRPLFGHAALVVGYNNTELTWTLLNSYGTQRFTRDGLFKIAMGVAGVAVPDQTFGIECKPTPGGPDDMHSTDWLTPWIRDAQLRPRKPVDYWDRARDWNNLNTSCYRYNTSAGDTVSGIADAFGVSLQQLVRDNQALFPLQQVNYTLKTGTQLKDLQNVAAVANKLRLANSTEPFFVCRTYTGQTWFGSRTCRQSDLAPCAGAWACKIVFSEADVSVPLPHGTAFKVCGISRVDQLGAFDRVAYLKEPRDSQPRAFKALLKQLPASAEFAWISDFIKDDPAKCYGFRTDDGGAISANGFWMTCDTDKGIVTAVNVEPSVFGELTWPLALNALAMYPLLSFNQLSSLQFFTSTGTLPPQLGALNLSSLSIRILCSSKEPNNRGPLPSNWLLGGWSKSLTRLRIGSWEANFWDIGSEPGADGRCGVTGTLPARWFQPNTPTVLRELDLSFNKLVGSLPQLLPKVMPKLEVLNLANNSFEGTIPPSLATLNLSTLALSGSKLSGLLPFGLKPNQSMSLDDNTGLRGCVPFVSGRDPNLVSYANTAISGMCSADAQSLWSQQLQALDVMLPALMGLPFLYYSAFSASPVTTIALNLPQTVDAFFARLPADPSVRSFGGIIFQAEPGVRFDVRIPVINGVPCIAQLYLQVNLWVNSVVNPVGAVNMTALPGLLRRLPCIESLELIGWEYKPGARFQLPTDLPTAAPSLKSLTLSNCGLTGTIPDWKGWTGLQKLVLATNFFTGTLPEWRDMKNMQFLDLSGNNISGTLPAAWAESMPASLASMSLGIGNRGINGSIPASWWRHFSGATTINLVMTSLTGCRPPGWQNKDWDWSEALATAPFCAVDEAGALQQAKQLLEAAIPSSALLSTWTAEVGSGLVNTLPAHCSTWQGITCNANGQVLGVDMSSLQGAVVTSSLNMTTLLQPLAGLAQLQTLKLHNNPQLFNGSSIPGAFYWSAWPKLQHLDVSNCGLTGSLPSSLGEPASLVHLNTSHNPGISGTLPQRLASTSLAVLDVFECGLTGQLPVGFTVLPLQFLRVGSAERPASADESISGLLPPEYGMIDTLRELHIVNSWVTGSIPTAWFDPNEAAMAAPASAAAPAAEGLSMQQLEVLVLSGNSELEGSLPAQLAALKQLKVLRLSDNKLTGLLPRGYGRMSQLQELDLSGNQLSGVIPLLWLGLRSLTRMDLSGNPAIGGTLPEDLYDLASPERSLRCLRLFGTGVGGLSTVKANFEGRPGSQVKVAISNDAPEC